MKRKRIRTKEYAAWSHMRNRCNNPKHPRYADYGGRGIKVCERWSSFKNFLSDVGLAHSVNHSLDRYPDNNGNYEPGNVRWATIPEQLSNTRQNNLISYNGQTKTLTEWAKEIGINRATLSSRLNKFNWNVNDALAIKAQHENYKLRR